jgi:hypothetical protein
MGYKKQRTAYSVPRECERKYRHKRDRKTVLTGETPNTNETQKWRKYPSLN